jgi:hypothetical protein
MAQNEGDVQRERLAAPARVQRSHGKTPTVLLGWIMRHSEKVRAKRAVLVDTVFSPLTKRGLSPYGPITTNIGSD